MRPRRIDSLPGEARAGLRDPRRSTMALHHLLSVVLWQLDELARDTRVILICRHGYSSSLAAARLQELGFRRATDVDGGFEAWQAAGLPMEPV